MKFLLFVITSLASTLAHANDDRLLNLESVPFLVCSAPAQGQVLTLTKYDSSFGLAHGLLEDNKRNLRTEFRCSASAYAANQVIWNCKEEYLTNETIHFSLRALENKNAVSKAQVFNLAGHVQVSELVCKTGSRS